MKSIIVWHDKQKGEDTTEIFSIRGKHWFARR